MHQQPEAWLCVLRARAQMMAYIEAVRARQLPEPPALAEEGAVAWRYPPLAHVQEARRRRQELLQQQRLRKASSSFPLARPWRRLQAQRRGEASQPAGPDGADRGDRRDDYDDDRPDGDSAPGQMDEWDMAMMMRMMMRQTARRGPTF